MADPTTSYCTLTDLKTYFGEREVVHFADRDGSGVEDAATISAMIGMVSSEIETYLRVRYTLPLPSVSPVLKRVACDMVRYYLFTDMMTKAVQFRYDAAIKFLEDLAAGVKSLGDDYDDKYTSSVQYSTNDRVLSRSNLEVIT